MSLTRRACDTDSPFPRKSDSGLADTFNHCVQNKVFTDKLKLAKVIPVFKSGAKDITPNYRPITNLSHFSKTFEKLIHKNLVTFLVLIT